MPSGLPDTKCLEVCVLEVCVARYNESTDWLKGHEFELFSIKIYNKGSCELSAGTPSSSNVIQLSNVGRESHTFLHHIVTNYDSLADVTVFLPSSCMDEARGKRYKTMEVIDKVTKTCNSVFCGAYYDSVYDKYKTFTVDNWGGTNCMNKETTEISVKPATIRPFGDWYTHFFDKTSVNVVSYMSIFAVSKYHIQQHPRSYYESMMPCCCHHINPEEGHFIERAWVAIFHPLPDSCLFTYDAR